MADSVSTLLTREAVLSDSLLRATRASVATRDPQRILQELVALDVRLRAWAKKALSDSVARGAAQMLVASLRGGSQDVLLAVRRCRLRARCSLLRTFEFLSKERLQLAEEAAVLLGSHVRQLIQRQAYLRQRLSVSRSKADAENMLVAGHRIAPKHPHQSHDAHKARVLGSFRSDQAALLAVEQRLRSVGALQLGAAFKAPLATLPGSSFQTALDYNRIVRDSAAVGQLDALTRAASRAADHSAELEGKELEGLCTGQASTIEMPPLCDLPAWQVGERRRRAAVRANGIVRTAQMVMLAKERTAFEARARVLEALLSTQSTLRKLASATTLSSHQTFDGGGAAAEPPTPTPVPAAAPASPPGPKEVEEAEAADESEVVPATTLTARRHRSRLNLTSPEGAASRLSAPAWSAPLHSLLRDLELLDQEGAFGEPAELKAALAEPGAAVSSVVSSVWPASPAPVSPVLGRPASDLSDLSDLSERGGSPGGGSPGLGVAVAMAPLLQAMAHSLSSLRLVTAATSQPPRFVRTPTNAPTQPPTHPHPPLRLSTAAAPTAAPCRGEARHSELGPPLWRPPPAVTSAAPAMPPAPLPAGPLPTRPKPLARAMSSQLGKDSMAPAWIPSGRPSGLLRPTSAAVPRAPRVFEASLRTRGETIRRAPSLCREGTMAGGVPERTTERLARVGSVLLPLETPSARRVQLARRAPCWVE